MTLDVPSLPKLRHLVALLALGAAACTRAIPPEDAVGVYVMNRGGAADTLLVRQGGTYVRRYAAPGRPAIAYSGRWTADTVGSRLEVRFAAFAPRWRLESAAVERQLVGWWPVRPERSTRGIIRLPVDKELGWAYVRVGPAE